MFSFQHLQEVKQSYFEHLQDTLSYCKYTLYATFCFFLHGIYPDIYTKEGSTTLRLILSKIDEKTKSA
jgi:hypothetical protein